MPATYNHGLAKGRNAGGAIAKNRFVVQDTTADDGETVIQASSATDTVPPIGVSIFGVSTAEIAQGKGVSVVMDGIAVVTAGSALTVGMIVTTDADGKAVEATTGDWICGYVNEPADAEDDVCSVFLSDPGSQAA